MCNAAGGVWEERQSRAEVHDRENYFRLRLTATPVRPCAAYPWVAILSYCYNV